MKYPMITGGPLIRFSDFVVLGRRVLKCLFPVLYHKNINISDNVRDRIVPFDEYPPCEYCGCEESREMFLAKDGNRIAECTDFGLWFTSPRIAEKRWKNYLSAEDAARNRDVTECRLRHGVALQRNIRFQFSFWWRLVRRKKRKIWVMLIAAHGGAVERVHDVGCGVGLSLYTVKEMGLKVSGNDLNAYAVNRMQEVLGLDVNCGRFCRSQKTDYWQPPASIF